MPHRVFLSLLQMLIEIAYSNSFIWAPCSRPWFKQPQSIFFSDKYYAKQDDALNPEKEYID